MRRNLFFNLFDKILMLQFVKLTAQSERVRKSWIHIQIGKVFSQPIANSIAARIN